MYGDENGHRHNTRGWTCSFVRVGFDLESTDSGRQSSGRLLGEEGGYDDVDNASAPVLDDS